MTTKEHAKNFKDWEILAFLNNKKTQFREAMNPQPRIALLGNGQPIGNGQLIWDSKDASIPFTEMCMYRIFNHCPYNIGDYIWGQEAFCSIKMNPTSTPLYFYKVGYKSISGESVGWTHPICMPRKASRILQQITDIRIEQLQDISEDDCLAEGIEYQGNAYDTIAAFAEKRKDWELNPYTWVYEVKEIKND
jgi:hypothetical protein